MFFGFGYPATKATGFAKAIPTYRAAVAPYGAWGKPFGAWGKPFGLAGKPFVKPYGFGYPATKAAGYTAAVPVTSVATSPVPGVI